MKKVFYRLWIVYLLTQMGALEPGHWLDLSARGVLLDKQLKGFVSPLACRQAFLAYHDAALAAARVSLSYGLLVSCLAMSTALWAIKRTEQGRLVLERQRDALPQVLATAALLGTFMVVQGYLYYLQTKVIESSYQVDLYKCR